MKEGIHLLFSYGTLQLENVQLENYGRTLRGERDRLIGYKIEKTKSQIPRSLPKVSLIITRLPLNPVMNPIFWKESYLKSRTLNLGKPTTMKSVDTIEYLKRLSQEKRLGSM